MPIARRNTHAVRLCLCGTFLGLFAGVALGAERHLEFLHGLQARGYGDMAVLYLESLGGPADQPPAVRAVWDLEMSRSLRAAATTARSLAEQNQLEKRAEAHLNLFSERHPGHPAILASYNAWGTAALERGIARAGLLGHGIVTPVASVTAQRAQADFAEGQKYFERTLASVPPRPAPAQDAEDPEAAQEAANLPNPAAMEAMLRLALTDYWLAQLAAASGAPDDAKPILEATRKRFADLGKELDGEQAALVANYWQARCLFELGEFEPAATLCDDVLGQGPGPEEEAVLDTEEQFFAEAFLLRLQSLARLNRDVDVVSEAAAWIKERGKRPLPVNGETILFELAKARLRMVSQLPVSERAAARSNALKQLAKLADQPGPHQFDALSLFRIEQADLPPGVPRLPPESFLTYARLCEQRRDWDQVELAYAEALAAAEANPKGDVKPADVRNGLANMRLQQAQTLVGAGEIDKAFEIVAHLLDDLPDTKSASSAAQLAVAVAKRQVLQAAPADRVAAVTNLDKICAQVIAKWPNRPEADDARLAQAQVAAADGDPKAAVEKYAELSPKSAKYGAARLAAGQVLWREYLRVAKAKPTEGNADAPASFLPAPELLAEADKLLRQALEQSASVSPLGDQVAAETRIMLAQMQLEQSQGAAALELLEPLLAALTDAQLAVATPLTQRLVQTAVRAHAAADQGGVSEALLLRFARAASDTIESNNVLVDGLRTLAGADLRALKTDRPALIDLARLLATRRKLSPLAAVLVAEANQGDLPQRSRELYEAALAQAAEDPAAKQALRPYLPRIQLSMIRLLSDERKYAVALKYVDELLVAQPKQLSLWMEKGRLLQNSALTDEKYLEPALAHWTQLRKQLGAKRGPEYFEAVYSAAFDLFRLGGPERLQQAEQLLRATLITSPRLSGESEVQKYDELLEKVKTARARIPA